MAQALYRKYRSKSWSEVVGQQPITKTLSRALASGRLSHAYLLTGPKGVGKTSVARILAHEVNQIPYKDESPHLDIIEIDAASNRRIDEIRDLRDKVYISPASAKYKVYIIDEVHMLTKEAFNALLKMLEEPPEHVIFILATTDAHKLPETIISRTQRFNFKPIDPPDLTSHLSVIAKKEKINIAKEALDLIAEHSSGSFRDAISLLDQLRSRADKVSPDDVLLLVGIPPAKSINKLLAAINAGQTPKNILNDLGDLTDQGYQPAAIAKVISRQIRDQLLNRDLVDKSSAKLLKQLLDVPLSAEPGRFLEIILLEAAATVGVDRANNLVRPVNEIDIPPKSNSSQPTKKPPVENLPVTKIDSNLWPEVLSALKKRHNTLYGVVRMAQAEFKGNQLILTFAFAFHQKRLEEDANANKLVGIIKEVSGQSVDIDCRLDKSLSTKPLEATPPKEMTTISNIFGGAELLES